MKIRINRILTSLQILTHDRKKNNMASVKLENDVWGVATDFPNKLHGKWQNCASSETQVRPTELWKKNTFTNSVNIKAFVELNQLVLKSSGAELVSSSHVLHGRNVIIFAQFRTVPHRFNVCEQLRRCSPMQKQLFLTVMNRLRMCCDIMISTTAITG